MKATGTPSKSKHVALDDYILIDPDILGGDPVFCSGCPLGEFLENFPSVTHDAAVAVLMGAQELTLAKAGR